MWTNEKQLLGQKLMSVPVSYIHSLNKIFFEWLSRQKLPNLTSKASVEKREEMDEECRGQFLSVRIGILVIQLIYARLFHMFVHYQHIFKLNEKDC